ncbi:4-hydroxy-3-methylbut-2-enyl diphosphate reductase [Candidatus Omnitrophota bacterium]
MKINLAKSAGFCFGVKRALQIAWQTTKDYPNVYMLGDIVHNEYVIKKIQGWSIKKISRLSKVKNKVILIRAHGASINTYAKAKKFGYDIVDATCPMVKEIHKIARHWEAQGYQIIVIGDKEHDEVRGIIGQIKSGAIVIDQRRRLPVKTLKRVKKAAIVVQSTQNIEQVLAIVDKLKKIVKELKFCNTICQPTRKKQQETKIMPLENQAMVIIGSRTSANTKRLYQISKALNKRTYRVGSAKDLRPEWFKDLNTVGVTSGASTPDSTTQAVINQIRRYF